MEKLSHDKIVIGVSGHDRRSKSVRAMIKQLQHHGATVVFLSSYVENINADVKRDAAWIDALIVMGNDLDIDPNCYIKRYAVGDPKCHIHPQTRSELTTVRGKARARYEEAMLKQVLACGIPVLGICGGMHRINVLCGGTLHQHVPDLVGCDKHQQQKKGIAPHIPIVPIVIKDHTMLADMASGIQTPFVKKDEAGCPKVIMENSMHHQAVDIVAPDFRVCAVTDTIRFSQCRYGFMVQAIEADPEGKYGKQFTLGVQWHPEFGASALGVRIASHLIKAASAYAKKRGKVKKNSFRAVYTIYTDLTNHTAGQ